MPIRGRCHCGNVSFVLDGFADAAPIPARACDCTFCTKHGAAWTSCAGGSLEVAIGDPDRVARYRFATSTADFHVCTRCGGAALVTSEVDGTTFAVVNVRLIEGVDAARFVHSAASLDGEARDARLARRAANWIGRVRFVDAGNRDA